MPRYRARRPMPRHYDRLGFTLEVDPIHRTGEVLKWLRDCERLIAKSALPILQVTGSDIHLQVYGRVSCFHATPDFTAYWSYPAGEQARL